ncbi:MAG: CHAT domain-containing protein, partial [Desulfuromonadales bacterium]
MAIDTKQPIQLRIPGTEITEPIPEVPPETTGQITIKEVRTFRISAARAGETETPVIESHPDDIVEVELEDGTRFWTSQERLRTEVLGLAGTRAADGVVELPATIARRSATRGFVGKIVIKTLKFFKIDVAEKAARFISGKLENHLLGTKGDNRGPGLYRFLPGAELQLAPVSEAVVTLPADRPSLLFLHGTASSTAGSFGKLWTEKRRTQREQLLTPYEGRVFGLEHETLTKSPIDNAIAVAERLPPGARLHLVSHSRGGMVGELLCRAGMEGGRDPFDAADLSFFAERNPDKARGDLERLNSLLREKRFRIERFVRVACPARGTTLASERLDIYLSVLFNLLGAYGFITKLSGGIITSIFSELIMAVAKERTDPTVLPGIEAMVPSSPLVALLNRAKAPVAGELRVIAGDIEGDNVLSAIGTLLTDPLYQDDHDLVVNTDAMFGGSERSGRAGFLFRRGPDVNHFSYFENADSAEGLARTLSRTGSEADGFEPFSVRETDSGTPPYEKRDVADGLPVVFVLPGIMGSHLAIDENRIWLDPLDIAVGKFKLLGYGTPNLVQAEAPLWMFYGGLVKHLARTHRVEPFPFDWRLSVFDEAKRLAAAITKALDETEKSRQPVSIVAHSMGGLVARAMVAAHREVWERMKGRAEARLIMLGTPNGGSHAVAQVLTGRDSLIRKLALLDTTRKQRDLIGIVAKFPGLLEMLPALSSFDLFDASAWQNLAAADPEKGTWQPPTAAALKAAHANREKLASSPIDPERMLYIAGCAPATPVDLTLEGEGAGQRLVFHATPRGDGRVPWDTGIPNGVRTWFLQASHGDLPACDEGFDAITDLLRRGTTDRLPTAPPETRGVPDRFELPAERTPLYPDFTDLARTAMGAGRTKQKRRTERKIQISVRHGNLAFAGHPVLVGHYRGDTIVSAEAYLDRTLDGRLSARHRLRIYPGDDDTAEVFLNPEWEQSQRGDGKPPGAIVIGLGEVGKLSPGRLLRAVSRGARSYSLSRAECPQVKSGKAGTAGISCLLVGTGAGGVSVQDAVTAILRGIIDANRSIADSGRPGLAPIEDVEFVELFEDRAIQAARTLARLRNDPEISRAFAIDQDPLVLPLEGGMRRASFIEEDPWWQRLQITEDEEARLSYNLLTDRARAEVYLQQSQRSLADTFIEEMSSTTASSEGVAVTLFEMLVPNEIKEYAPDRRDMVLVLNDAAARYPWEMMQERRRSDDTGQDRKPLAVQAGMVRQLLVEKFRDRVVTARDTTALVIGNPSTPFANLPAAEQEAREVEKALKASGYAITPLIGPEATGPAILTELFARDYRIVHLAGHGVFEYRPPVPCGSCHQQTDGTPFTGMVIGENQFLTAAQIRQMRSVPQLVFVNCCHLGKIDDKQPPRNVPPNLAANVATELIRMGVRGVVAAGWAVQDDAAALFAATFYREILAGSTFGYATHAARAATYAAHPEANTWGAYQCYGDPDFTLGKGDSAPLVRRRRISFTTPSEAIVDLENIAAAAKTARGPAVDAHLKTIREIEQSVPPGWLASGALQAALGQAWGELKRFAEAVDHYRRAIADDRGLATIKTAEQLWNLQSRWAQELAANDPARALELVKEAEKRLEELNRALGETGERLALLGSVAKRRMMIATEVAAKRDALYAMAEHYRRAYELGAELGRPDFYPLVNQLASQTLAYLLEEKGELPPGFGAAVDKAIQLAEDEHRNKPNFWNTVAPVDCLLLRHLAEGDLSDYTTEISDDYARAKNLGSPREFQSVLDQLDFLAKIITSAPVNEIRRGLLAALREIRQSAEAAGTGDEPRQGIILVDLKPTTPGAFPKSNLGEVRSIYTHTPLAVGTGFPLRLKRS